MSSLPLPLLLFLSHSYQASEEAHPRAGSRLSRKENRAILRRKEAASQDLDPGDAEAREHP